MSFEYIVIALTALFAIIAVSCTGALVASSAFSTPPPRTHRRLARRLSRGTTEHFPPTLHPECARRTRTRRRTASPESTAMPSPLTALNLSFKQLSSLPESIVHNSMLLRELNLRNNNLSSLPESIGNLNLLRKLNLRNNNLSSLPESIGNLNLLCELNLRNNNLSSLPESICNLRLLRRLNLRNNSLSSLPESIDGLASIERLDLRNNRLSSLPRSLGDLPNLAALNLKGNLLAEYGVGDSLGWMELIKVLHHDVVLSLDPLTAPQKHLSVQDVYSMLEAMPLRWNFHKLRNLALAPVPLHTRRAPEILAFWETSLSSYAPDTASSSAVADYIKASYGIDQAPQKKSTPHSVLAPTERDYIDAVFARLALSNETAVSATHVPELCKIVTLRPEQRLAELSLMHLALLPTSCPPSFPSFVENEVAALKDYICEMALVLLLPEDAQGTSVRRFWKQVLLKILESDPLPASSPRRSPNGFALNVFYTKFTPAYVAAHLAEAINSRSSRLSDSVSFLTTSSRDSCNTGRAFELHPESGAPARIRPEGAEDILVLMGLLQRTSPNIE